MPGFAIGLSWRIRLLAACCLAPLLSLFVIGSSALAAHFTGQRWGVSWVVVLACVLAVAGLWRWRRGQREWVQSLRHQSAVLGGYLGGIAIAVATLGRRLMWAFGNPDTIAQRYDNAFHLNASVYVYLSGRASSFDVGKLLGLQFYPASFHDAVALVMSASGLWVAPAVHAVNIFAIFVMWPLSLVLIVEPFFRMNWVGRIALGPLSLGLNMFPYTLMDWGLIYPNILALSVTPALIGLGFSCLGKGNSSILTSRGSLALTIPAVVGAGLAHPNSIFLMIGACLPLAILNAFRLFKGGYSDLLDRIIMKTRRERYSEVSRRLVSRVIGLLCMLAMVVAVPVAWYRASIILGPGSSQWKPFQTTAQAVGESLLGTGMGRAPFPLGIFVVVGFVWLVLHWRGRLWWGLGAGILASFYIVTSSLPQSSLRSALTGVFYTDSYRTAAYLTIVAVPFAILGVQWIWRYITFALLRVRPSLLGSNQLKSVEVLVALTAAVASCFVTAGSASFSQQLNVIQRAYTYAPDSSILSKDEMTLLEEIERVTSPRDVIVVDPWTGAGLVYALAQRMPTQFYMLSPVDADVSLVNEKLRYAANDPQVCAAVHRLGATYALTLDPRRIADMPLTSQYEGLVDLGRAPGFEPVARVGGDALYRITACG